MAYHTSKALVDLGLGDAPMNQNLFDIILIFFWGGGRFDKRVG